MAWQQLQVKANSENAELISDILLGLGSIAITLLDAKDQPLLEPGPGEMPLWDEAWVSALFTKDTNIETLLIQLQTILANSNLEYRVIPLADKNWLLEWLEYFKPMKFGEKLWITSKEQFDKITTKKDSVVVVLEPGLAFGTGAHPTTALCLTWLEQIIKTGMTIIDYGCGSGILAIAAVKLGAKKAYCIDNDMQALTATRENADRNALSEKQILTFLPDDFPKNNADVLIANILANPLIELAPKFSGLIKTHGLIGLSGILADQVNDVEKTYSASFELEAPRLQENWCLLVGRKKYQ